MRQGVDSNVLVYAHIPTFPEHARVRVFLTDFLAQADALLAFTPAILHEFVHIITDARRFSPPVEMSEALAVARLYVDRENTECLSVTESDMAHAFDLLERHGLGRKRIADTLFASTLLRAGISELITCNPDDFKVFDELKVIDPR
jgi:predicted nucleic acid-binding protein